MPDHCIDTQLVWLGSRPDPQHGSVTTPIFQSSTFSQTSPGEYGLYDYTRTDNPTRSVLQQMLAASEGAQHGLAFSSGMAAIDCVFGLLAVGDHIITSDDLYGGTYRYLLDVAKHRGIEFSFVNIADEATLRAAVKPNTKLVWFESPTNPLLNLVDISMVVRVAKDNGLLTAIDNTFMSPYFQQPLKLGVDFVMHSMTKYLNGHSDVVMGALMTNDDKSYERLKYLQNAVGPTPSPFDCFLAIRGMKTLGVRMKQHASNAQYLAEALEGNPKIENVIYPGLESHPHHHLAKKQMSGFGGMMSLRVKGDVEATKRFLCSTKLFTLAVSLGGVESLFEQPATMTHFEMPKEVRESVGITDNLVRVSVGIEDPRDLLKDLESGLEAV